MKFKWLAWSDPNPYLITKHPQYRDHHKGLGRMYKLGENIASNKNRYQTYKQNQCRGEPCVRPSDINLYQTNYVRE